MADATSDAALDSLRRRAEVWTVICVVAGLIAFTGNFLPDRWLFLPATAFVVFIATIWPAYRLRKKYELACRRRETQPISLEAIEAFETAPVLYLRSFDDDARASRIKGEWTEEEHLRSVLSQLGPVIAVGRPGESVPTTGAARVYLGDSQWQSAVEHMLGVAKLVVIRTGGTRGLHWEVDRAIRLLQPERLVLLVDNRHELRSLLAMLRAEHSAVPRRLWLGWRSIGHIRGFVVFDQQWRATCLRAGGPGLYFFCNNAAGVGHATKRLAWTLRPLFQRLGLSWQRPTLNWGLIVSSAVAATLFLLAFVFTAFGY